MKYEAPKATALTPAINAIQTGSTAQPKQALKGPDGAHSQFNEHVGAYADWE